MYPLVRKQSGDETLSANDEIAQGSNGTSCPAMVPVPSNTRPVVQGSK